MNTAGVAKSYLAADEAAVSWFRRSIETNRNVTPFVHFYLAAAFAHLERIEEARISLQAGVCTENAIRVYRMMESARLARWLR